MAEETITILKVGTSEAVKSVQDLKNNIKVLKETLAQLDIGSKDYKDALKELKTNQNALKDAMYASSASMEDLSKAARGTSETYNSLVHRMAQAKEALRNIDTSTKEGKESFKNMAAEIKATNDKLIELDELQGNHTRKVGSYSESLSKHFKGLSDKLDGLRKGLKAAEGGLNGFKEGAEGIAKSPMVGTIGILVSLAMKLAMELKDNEDAMASIKKLMEALKPVMEFISGIVQKLADYLGDVIAKVTEFLGNNGLIDKVIKGVTSVGNAIFQAVIAPIKGVIEAIKVLKEKGLKEGLKDAADAFGKEIKSGFAFKQNFQAGQKIAETIIAGAKSKKKEVTQAGTDLSKDFQEGIDLKGIEQEIQKQMEADIAAMLKAEEDANKIARKMMDERLKGLDKYTSHQLELNEILTEDEREKAEKAYTIQEEANQKRLSLLRQFADQALSSGDMDSYLDFWEQIGDMEVEIETHALREKQRLRALDLKDAEDNAKQQKAILQGVANATSDILKSIADYYDQDSENSEKNAQKIKALRIASATIDTISGAIGAYMQSVQTIPPPAGQIVGAIQAAAVTAAGLAQIAQIKNTQVKASATNGEAAVTPMVGAIQAAPMPEEAVTPIPSITSASQEDRLNRMASQRVYILSSDIEASQNARKTQVRESSF